MKQNPFWKPFYHYRTKAKRGDIIEVCANWMCQGTFCVLDVEYNQIVEIVVVPVGMTIQGTFKQLGTAARRISFGEVKVIARTCLDPGRSKPVQHVSVESNSVVFKKAVKKTNIFMQTINFFKNLIDKDTATLKKAGYLNDSLGMTEEGHSELLGILFMQNKDALVKLAQEKLDEEKAGK